MKNAADTAGPWSYNRDEGGVHGYVISTADYIICELPDAGDGASPHIEANARLIAAAPDLLEAAELVIARWSDGDLAEGVRFLDSAVTAAKAGAI
jgi:hypothetical protein